MANSVENQSSSSGSGSGNTIVAVFDNRSNAKQAVGALTSSGIAARHIQLNPQDDSSDSVITSNDTAEGADEGGRRGFFKSLFGGGDDREYHDTYSESVRRGHYVLTVDAQSDEELNRVSEIINQYNPVDIDERSSVWKQQGWTGYDASAPRFNQDEITKDRASYASLRSTDTTTSRSSNLENEARIPVVEEELKVGKREVQRGGVRVFKRVTETPVNESVQLRDEHVKVERHPVSGDASRVAGDAFKEESFELRESAEEAVVSKSARVVEEVVVGKEVSQRTENIKDSVRRTDVEVEQLSGSNLQGTNRLDDDGDYRSHWQTNFGSSGGRYEDYAPAYSYGSTLASNEQYRGRQWEEYEPQVRSDWESSHPGSTWDKVKDAVRYGAQRVTGNRNH